MKPDKPTEKQRILHILEAIELIQKFSNHTGLEDFSNDQKSYYACLFQYAIIGEAVVHMNPELLKKYDYPWYKVKSFRNFILHEYHAIDARVVWDTTRIVLPGLKEMLEKILKDEFE
jgi:uncharacterized protein with HEPN domain